MSIKLMLAVREHGPDCATQFAVLTALADQANDNGESCFPSYATLARMTRFSRRTVIRTVQNLEKGGWIAVERGQTRKNGSFSSNAFKIYLEPLGMGEKPSKIASDTVNLPSDTVNLPSDKGSLTYGDRATPADTTLTNNPSADAASKAKLFAVWRSLPLKGKKPFSEWCKTQQ